MYSWGAVSNGELGLGGLEKSHVSLPSKVPFNDNIRWDCKHGLYLVERLTRQSLEVT